MNATREALSMVSTPSRSSVARNRSPTACSRLVCNTRGFQSKRARAQRRLNETSRFSTAFSPNAVSASSIIGTVTPAVASGSSVVHQLRIGSRSAALRALRIHCAATFAGSIPTWANR